MRAPKQLPLPEPNTWGGRRAGAGRKRVSPRPNVPHVTRPAHVARFPLHATLRRADDVPSLRNARVFRGVRAALRNSSRGDFRLIHFSVQRDHIHLIAEAADKNRLTRGLQGLAIRVALAINRVLQRKGKVWGDRYHSRELKTPREVRYALAYVLLNSQKHSTHSAKIDYFSSAAWFDGWRERIPGRLEDSPVAPARTWLLVVGWRRGGLLSSIRSPADSRSPNKQAHSH
jgi:hypothetical protein